MRVPISIRTKEEKAALKASPVKTAAKKSSPMKKESKPKEKKPPSKYMLEIIRLNFVDLAKRHQALQQRLVVKMLANYRMKHPHGTTVPAEARIEKIEDFEEETDSVNKSEGEDKVENLEDLESFSEKMKDPRERNETDPET